jgi:hypothetical protein
VSRYYSHVVGGSSQQAANVLAFLPSFVEHLLGYLRRRFSPDHGVPAAGEVVVLDVDENQPLLRTLLCGMSAHTAWLSSILVNGPVCFADLGTQVKPKQVV